MSTRQQLLNSIADTIQDYRSDDPYTSELTPEHVDCWVEQFDKKVRVRILREMDHVLKQTYYSQERMTKFLKGVINTQKLVGDDPCKFWQDIVFLDIQRGGNSQTDMLAIFNELLQDQCGFGTAECGDNSSTYLYLDDCLFTGKRVRRDLKAWIINKAPAKAKLHVVAIALHSNGFYYTEKSIEEAVAEAEKEIEIIWWCSVVPENRVGLRRDSADVLRPTLIPKDANVQAYVEQMKYPPKLRSSGYTGLNSLYTNDKEKILLEQEFLKAGARIRQLIPDMGVTQRPLGHSPLDTLGFGSLIVTYRNCPNNAPLALWIGDPWYPLFPRLTHNEVEFRRRQASWKNEA